MPATKRTDQAIQDWRAEWREWDRRTRSRYNRDVAAGYFGCALALLVLAIVLYYFAGQLGLALTALEIWR